MLQKKYTMEIKNIYREYDNLKFFYKKSNYSEKKYIELFNCDEYLKMKEIFILYSEEKLQIIFSYIFLIKKIIIPIITLLILIIPHMIIILFMLLYVSFKLSKLWHKTTTIYSLEITALDDFINQKYNTSITTNFN